MQMLVELWPLRGYLEVVEYKVEGKCSAGTHYYMRAQGDILSFVPLIVIESLSVCLLVS